MTEEKSLPTGKDSAIRLACPTRHHACVLGFRGAKAILPNIPEARMIQESASDRGGQAQAALSLSHARSRADGSNKSRFSCVQHSLLSRLRVGPSPWIHHSREHRWLFSVLDFLYSSNVEWQLIEVLGFLQQFASEVLSPLQICNHQSISTGRPK
jgi:hypothetical protein